MTTIISWVDYLDKQASSCLNVQCIYYLGHFVKGQYLS